ncbi:hypothetical protein QE385_003257 [Sphingomonas sp. SORGH_AS 950]|nr:hypothetical protein [Sphingomonas sp. SORGH_AS_0950]
MPITKALTHMHAALQLLDDAKADLSAIYLQTAIDIVEGVPPLQPGDPFAEWIDRCLVNRAEQTGIDTERFVGGHTDPRHIGMTGV